MSTILKHEKLVPGYAEMSTRRNPKEPTTVVVSADDCNQCNCVGSACIDGSFAWLAFRHRKTGKYYFQFRPW